MEPLITGALSGLVSLSPYAATSAINIAYLSDLQISQNHYGNTTLGFQYAIKSPTTSYTETPMSDGSNYRELDAKLDAVELRGQLQLQQLEAKIDRLSDAITGENGIISAMREIRADNKNTRATIIITVIGATLAALGALWTTQSNLLSAVQANFSAQPAMNSVVETPPANDTVTLLPPTNAPSRGKN